MAEKKDAVSTLDSIFDDDLDGTAFPCFPHGPSGQKEKARGISLWPGVTWWAIQDLNL